MLQQSEVGVDCPRSPCSPSRHTARRDEDESPPPPCLPTRRAVSPLAVHSCETGRDENEGRFAREFSDVKVIGRGQFSTVCRARNKLDGHVYAVKKTDRIGRGSQRQSQLGEIFALAAVAVEHASCPHVVRYFSSWLEDERLHIQTELCECSLRDIMGRLDVELGVECVLHVLRDVATGLEVLHSRNIAHMDVKPDNIFVGAGPEGARVYKLGDLGLAVAAIGSSCDNVSEGDCRYLAWEVMQGDVSQLPSADVFSLGLTVYELATNPEPLPGNGALWQQLRDGQLHAEALPVSLPDKFVDLLLRMVRAKPEQRPTCREILQEPTVGPVGSLQATIALQEVKSTLEAVRTQKAEAEMAAAQSQRRADEYFQELLFFKKRELLSGGASADQLPPSSTHVMPQRALKKRRTA